MQRVLLTVFFLSAFGVAPARGGAVQAAELEELSVLFLGDNGHHRPLDRAKQLIPVLETRGMTFAYTDRLEDLRAEVLSKHDVLVIYANWTSLPKELERSLVDWVAQGGGLVALHCASYCFLDSDAYIALVGAQFRSHGTGVFRTRIVDADHVITKDLWEFETWDETYVHTRHNDDKRVLQVRSEGGRDEPWTWVRTHGKGRVFYTAYGHDHRTFGEPAFHALVERGIRWAAGDDRVIANGLPRRDDLKPFEYTEPPEPIPNYLPGRSWGTEGEAIAQMQVPLEPAESQKHLVVPNGFEVSLFVAEPEIRKPICMNWDARGRLWIAETIDYPNELRPETEGRDRIRIIEDTDSDGRADKFTTFAENLSIPTSLLPYRDGVIVHSAPRTLFLRDTNGDDREDERVVILDGWSTGDTHAGPSNLRWGFDNWVWSMVGYSGFAGEAGGESHRFSTGLLRFKPDGSKLEFLRNTNNNSWGVGFTEDGLAFGSTANNCPSVYLPIPNRYYERVRGWSSRRLENTAISAKFYPITDKVRQVDQHGNFTAGAGHAFYTARLFPKHYWNRAAFVCGPTGHLVATFLTERVGSDVVTRNSWNLLASDDEWTAPIAAEVGPDGAVWVIDWYNYIVQHNPTPRGFRTGRGNAYETALRDKVHGRIYRIVPKGATLPAPKRLDTASSSELVASLRDDNLFWRLTAQRLLVERGELDVATELIALVDDPSKDEVDLAPAPLHGLWTLHGLGAMEDPQSPAVLAALRALRHPAASVRRAALQVLPIEKAPELAYAVIGAGSLLDEDAQVRLAAFLALSEAPNDLLVGRAIAAALADPMNANDRWIPDAATSAAAASAPGFLAALREWKEPPASETLEAIERVANHWARAAPRDSIEVLAQIELVVGALASMRRDIADRVVSGLADGWPAGETAPRGDASLVAAFEHVSAPVKATLIRLDRRWGWNDLASHAERVLEELRTAIADESRSASARAESARELVAFAPTEAEVVDAILEEIDARTPPELARGLLGALRSSRSDRVAPALIESFAAMTPEIEREAQEVLLSRPEWTRAFLAAAEAGEIDLLVLPLDRRQALSSHPDSEIAAKARKLLESQGGLPSADRQEVIEKFAALLDRPADPMRGREVYTQLCSRCHRHGEEGTAIGPDLTGMAAHPKDELLVHILDPNRSVEGNYRVYTVVTTRGEVLSGLLASESRTAMELIDSDAKPHVVERDDIAQFEGSRLSLMPEGFEQQVPEQGILDLLAFLTQRGKYLPLPLGKAATVVSTRGMFFEPQGRSERLIFRDWGPKSFEGVPFHLVDPQDGRLPNVIMLYGPQGRVPPTMPRSVEVPCNAPAKAIHFLSGVSGWGAQGPSERPSVSMIVRIHYEDGTQEDHELLDGVHFADYIRRFDVPGSKFAFDLRGRQMRYLAVEPKRQDTIKTIELVKGRDATAPLVMAITVESP